MTEQVFYVYSTFRAKINKWLEIESNAALMFDWQCFDHTCWMDAATLEQAMFESLIGKILADQDNKDELLADEGMFSFLKSVLKNHPQYKANIPAARIGTGDKAALANYISSQFTAAIIDASENPSEKTQATLLRSYFALSSVKSNT
jgi:hypothetical protein